MQAHPPVRAIDFNQRQRDGGYLLLAVLLMMAMMIITAAIELPRLVQQMKRDREEEMIHRGTEYSRAIKKFYKKFGRYPTTLEQLDNTNQIRFLRKRYKDPLSTRKRAVRAPDALSQAGFSTRGQQSSSRPFAWCSTQVKN